MKSTNRILIACLFCLTGICLWRGNENKSTLESEIEALENRVFEHEQRVRDVQEKIEAFNQARSKERAGIDSILNDHPTESEMIRAALEFLRNE